MLVSFEGVQGSAKTTAAVAIGWEEHNASGRKVISNQHLNFEHTKFSLEWFLEHLGDHELEDCILILDEMYQIADSRSSASKLNKLFTYFIVQTRKRGVDLYLCTHHLDHIDLRMRRAVDIRGSCRYSEKICPKCKCRACSGKGSQDGIHPCPSCEGRGGTGIVNGKPCEQCLGYGIQGWFKVQFLDRRARQRYPLERFANPYWHLFNSWDRIPLPAKALQGIDTTEVM